MVVAKIFLRFLCKLSCVQIFPPFLFPFIIFLLNIYFLPPPLPWPWEIEVINLKGLPIRTVITEKRWKLFCGDRDRWEPGKRETLREEGLPRDIWEPLPPPLRIEIRHVGVLDDTTLEVEALSDKIMVIVGELAVGVHIDEMTGETWGLWTEAWPP